MRREVDALHTEITALRQQNDSLVRRLDAMSSRIDAVAERSPGPAPSPAPAEAVRPLVPPDLAVVRVAPPRGARSAPPIPTAVTIAEPDPDRLDGLSQPGGRELAADAEAELSAARRKVGVDRARALEAFVSRYPRHPSADNALVEAARDYAEAGRPQAGCELARRVPEEYPAGDAVAVALEIAARCERSRP
jgi:hypothetical protein